MENEDDFDEVFGGAAVNYEAIIGSTTMLAVTRLLAATMVSNNYVTVGKFLRELSEEDLNILRAISEDSEDPRFEEIVLITLMLAQGEGIEGISLDSVTAQTNMFSTLLTIESLHRKKLVKFYHDNASLGDDVGNKIIVEKI